jgi:rsbT co-antagonist protein RsbR
MSKSENHIVRILRSGDTDILNDWLSELNSSPSGNGRISAGELQSQAREFLKLLGESGLENSGEISSAGAAPVRTFLESLSRSRASQGFTSEQTATFIFSLKKPIFKRLRRDFPTDAARMADETWLASELVDRLGLYTVVAFQKSREEIINRQQAEMLELSTPVVKLWHGVLALPLIGTLDSARTQVVMESLLQRIVETGSDIAIIDITGVPTVDTLVAQHLLKTVTAIRLMGAECIITGVRPQIAQTVVHLGIDLEGVTTKATLADGLSLALKRMGFVVSKPKV